jgi:hypothetical protein
MESPHKIVVLLILLFIYQSSFCQNDNSFNKAVEKMNFNIGWLMIQDCVADAYRDQCENKLAIFPGRSSIGVKFKTNSGIKEKCFSIQEGTTGQINILGWRPKISKSKYILSYKNTYDCEGFIEIQKQKCNQSLKSK